MREREREREKVVGRNFVARTIDQVELSKAERWIHTPKGGAQPSRMNSHASQRAGKGGGRLTPKPGNPPAIKGPRVPNPGHGHPHVPHLAAGLRLGGYTTQLEDSSSRYLNQEDPFEKLQGASQGHVLQPSRYPLVATSRWLLPQDCSQDDASQSDVDEGC